MIPDIVPVNTWAGNGVNTFFEFDFLIYSGEQYEKNISPFDDTCITVPVTVLSNLF